VCNVSKLNNKESGLKVKRLFSVGLSSIALILFLPFFTVQSVLADEMREPVDFSLTTDQGRWSLSELRGQVVFVFFGYTYCPDICPTSLQILAEAFDRLTPGELERVQGVFISLDPERDSAERLREYTHFFHPNILGVTGTPEELRAVTNRMGVSYRKAVVADEQGYSIDHSTLTFAIAPDGHQLMALVSHVAPPEYLVKLVRDSLAAPEESD
jgi:protein SCO1/2